MKTLFEKIFLGRTDFALLFGLSFLLHFASALVSTESFFPYFDQTINPIISTGNVPENTACILCDRPDLYQFISAGIVKILAISNNRSMMIACQMLSMIAGLGSLLLLMRLIQSFDWRSGIQSSVFALIAINPAFILTNTSSQPDAFCLVFSIAAIWQLIQHYQNPNPKGILLFTVFASLAALCLPIGILIFGVGIFVFFYNSLHNAETRKKLKIVAGAVFVFLAFVPFAGGYVNNAETGKGIFDLRPASPVPSWFDKTEVERPGIRSISDGFVTFRIYNLLQFPYNTNRLNDPFPAHRTSLWSQLYGKFWFGHFAQFPESKQDFRSDTLNVGRIIFALALIPFFVFLIGFFGSLFRAIYGLVTKPEFHLAEKSGIFLLFFISASVLLIKHCIVFRDFADMDLSFLMIVIPALLYFFGTGLDRIYDRYSKTVQNFINYALILLFVAQVQDMGSLILLQWPSFANFAGI